MSDNAGKMCIGRDPFCPCAEGDACHYAGDDPLPIPVRRSIDLAGGHGVFLDFDTKIDDATFRRVCNAVHGWCKP